MQAIYVRLASLENASRSIILKVMPINATSSKDEVNMKIDNNNNNSCMKIINK